MWRLLRPLLFLFDAEWIHHTMMGIFAKMMQIGWLRRRTRAFCHADDPALCTRVLDMEFPPPLGLAAGRPEERRGGRGRGRRWPPHPCSHTGRRARTSGRA